MNGLVHQQRKIPALKNDLNKLKILPKFSLLYVFHFTPFPPKFLKRSANS